MALSIKWLPNPCYSVYTISDFLCVQKQMYYMFTAYTHIEKLYKKKQSLTNCLVDHLATMLRSCHNYRIHVQNTINLQMTDQHNHLIIKKLMEFKTNCQIQTNQIIKTNQLSKQIVKCKQMKLQTNLRFK